MAGLGAWILAWRSMSSLSPSCSACAGSRNSTLSFCAQPQTSNEKMRHALRWRWLEINSGEAVGKRKGSGGGERRWAGRVCLVTNGGDGADEDEDGAHRVREEEEGGSSPHLRDRGEIVKKKRRSGGDRVGLTLIASILLRRAYLE